MTDYQAKKISDELRKYFRSHNIKQESVAQKLNVTRQYVSAILGGKPIGASIAKRLHQEFGFATNWLLYGQGNMFVSAELSKENIEDTNTHNSISDLKDELIKVLKSENEYLKAELAEKKAEIAELKLKLASK